MIEDAPGDATHVQLLGNRATSTDLETALRGAGYRVSRGPIDGSVAAGAEVTVVDLRSVEIERAATVLREPALWVAPILVVSDPSQSDHRVLGLQLGISDDAIAPVGAAELRVRVERCRRGRTTRAGGSLGDVTLERVGRRVRRGSVAVHLTRREFEILHALAARAGAVVSKQVLLDEVWGEGAQPATINAVEAHVSSLRKKLDAIDAPFVRTVHGQGYVLEPDLSPARSR